MRRPSERWVIEANISKISTCFPIDLDTSDFVDITCFGDGWAKYLDQKTGKVHDCAEYYKQMLKEM